MSTKTANRTPSSQAAAAACIRKELKAVYSNVKFRVTSRGFSMGDAVDIDWTDGPTIRQVEALVGKYQYGHFDGMIDLYEYSNTRRDIPQTKYVQTQREFSRAVYASALDAVNQRFGWSLVIHPEWNSVTSESDAMIDNGIGWQSFEVHRLLYTKSLICQKCGASTMPTDKFCGECGAALTTDEE